MDPICRQYETPNDYWRVREFFRALRIANPRPSGNWHVGDFDYWRWHWLENVVERPPHELRYWENPEGQIIAALIQGDPGVCHPIVNPDAKTEALYEQMLAVAESEFLVQLGDGKQGLFAWSDVDNALLNNVLEARGYEQSSGGHGTEHYGWQSLRDAPAVPTLPKGYSLRSMGESDLPSRSLASWRAFHPGEPDEGVDPEGAWYRNIQRAPLYRRDLDVVAVAPESEDIAAFSLCYFDDVSRTGVIVLVGTSTPHQRKGLGKAVVTETLRRLHWLGAVGAYVSWYEPVPGALYESCGFTDQEIGKAWKRTL